MRKKIVFNVSLLLLFSASRLVVQAQPEDALLKELANANQQTIEALVLYPEDTRMAILEVTKYPSILIQVQEIKERTSLAFKALLEDFPTEEQSIFYELNRYPDLLEQLVQSRGQASAQKKAVAVMPEALQDRVLELIRAEPATLEKIFQLSQTAQIAFSKLLMEYPPVTQMAFEQLIRLPEVLELLSQDLRFTILVGDTYRKDSARIVTAMDSIHLVVAREQALELKDWQTTLEEHPTAAEELRLAGEAYANQNKDLESSPLLLDGYYNDDWLLNPIAISPYYYWFGYPWWEPIPRWYPYPWWWHWGGYYYNGAWMIIYLPSYHFMHWYFRHPHHHRHYNHLSEQFVRHYNKHRRSGTTITMEVKDWQQQNRTVLSESFLASDEGLKARLASYSDFEQKRSEYNQRHPSNQMDALRFIEKNGTKYPALKRSSQDAQNELRKQEEEETKKRIDWAPVKEPITPKEKPEKQARPSRIIQPAPKAPIQPKVIPRKPTEAKDYHFQKWEQQKVIPPTRKVPTPSRTETTKKRGG
jgi:hypothetical protein